ncbi:MAG TPA: hypothetical protein VK017_14950 [Sphingobacterium sp.]|jgi:hypothetical protein|nr:hypothetical protein [Sphingobacterium sp.]
MKNEEMQHDQKDGVAYPIPAEQQSGGALPENVCAEIGHASMKGGEIDSVSAAIWLLGTPCYAIF